MMQCYLCNSSLFSKRPGNVRDNKSLSILECKNCGLVCLNSFEHITKNFYVDSLMHDNNPIPIDEWLIESNVDDIRRFNQFKSFIKNKDILDFGCGAGGFLYKTNKISSSTCGIEPEQRVRNNIKNIKIYPDIKSLENKKFDLITSFHVFEHLIDPKAVLTQLALHLNENGKIIIEVPNSDDALLTLYENPGFQNFYWSKHLYLFNSSTLTNLINQTGLKIISIDQYQRYPLSNHLYWLSHNKPGGHEKWDFFDDKDLDKKYAKILRRVGRCDTIIAIISN